MEFIPFGDDMVIPEKPAHTHATPQFGCAECIKSDRTAWARGVYDAWRKTYKPPKCCGKPMEPYEWEIKPAGLTAIVACTVWDDDDCDEVQVVIA